MLRANCDHSPVTLTWSEAGEITHRGTYRIMKRSEKTRGSRRHAIVNMLVAVGAIIAIFGPTLLVVTDAWATGPGNGSGTPGGAGNSGGATGGPGASGGGGNSGGGNGGGNGNGSGNGGAGAAGNGASGVGGGNGNGVGGGNGSGGGAGSGGAGGAGGSGSGSSGSGNSGTGSSGSGSSGTGASGTGGSGNGGSGSSAGTSGGGNSGGGNASGASNGGSAAGDGGSGSGASAAGNGGSGGGIITQGNRAQDARLASTTDATTYRFLPGGVRKGTAFLTPYQEYTVDVFNACKAETGVNSAFLTALKTNGGFGFDNGEDNRGTQLLINCMASYGFTFPNVAVGPVENFTPVADVLEPALVKEAAEK